MGYQLVIIILYGGLNKETSWKVQRIIDGGSTCGYRPYAEKFGCIIYMSPQKTNMDWEYSITDPSDVIKFVNNHKDAIVLVLKHDPNRDKLITSKINNFKYYYSCNSRNMYNNTCNLSLVDTNDRLNDRSIVWFKGKDPDYWYHNDNKKYDIAIIGRRADKNELYFLNMMNLSKFKNLNIVWIGGEKHKSKIKCGHNVFCTEFCGPDDVVKHLSMAKIGVNLSEHPSEGFPQSVLEMAMCGLPVVYNYDAPWNNFYDSPYILRSNKRDWLKSIDNCLDKWDLEVARKVRSCAVKRFSLNRSYEFLVKLCE